MSKIGNTKMGAIKVTIKSKFFLVTTLLLSTAAGAQHGAHVHGEAQLTIAVGDNELHVEFESPAANLVGFEHAPQNPEQQRALDVAAQQLASADHLLRIHGAQCRLQQVQVAAPYSHTGSHVDHTSHASREEHSEHSSFRASYLFRCDTLAQLRTVDIALFASFPDIHEIKAQWLTPGQQGAAKLTAQHNELRFK